MSGRFDELRREYPQFVYSGYSVSEHEDGLHLSFDFSIPGLCEFHPQTRLDGKSLDIFNSPVSDYAKRMVFFIGLAEAVSYWKCACPPVFRVECGEMSEDDKAFFKKLWFNGLGEFFYRNGIKTDIGSFVSIDAPEPKNIPQCEDYVSSGIEIVPVGGGKDSAVTTELLRPFGDKLRFFTVNDQPARTQCVLAGGYSEDKIIKIYRTIDPELLKRNAEGFLNGHTPFSSVVAFISMYAGFIEGANDVILSNESSANESNIGGESVNHQYSKSFEFERDFDEFRRRNFPQSAVYFSLLRPFCELQIAKQFSQYKQYHLIFRSCNRGSKKNIWCCECPKCLFVAIMLSPFLPPDELNSIFGCDMLAKIELETDFDGLCGFTGLKPFECVGTADEVVLALTLTAEKYRKSGLEMPALLRRFCEKNTARADYSLLSGFNEENLIPKKFDECVKRMFEYVSAAD